VHVTSWLAANANLHAVPTPFDWPDRPDWRWTVDIYEDLAMARGAFRLFGANAAGFDYPALAEGLPTLEAEGADPANWPSAQKQIAPNQTASGSIATIVR